MNNCFQGILAWGVLSSAINATAVQAKPCEGLPSHAQVVKMLEETISTDNGGIFQPNAMWVTVIDRHGRVCVVAKVGDAWPGSRIISAQKASTANAFSNERLALSTANLYSAVQPGGTLFGLQHSNPVNQNIAYGGDAVKFGSKNDPMVGKMIGGVNVFGGGLPLYKDGKTVIGGIGASGDSSCTDHIIAWKLRQKMQLDRIPGGVSPNKDDNMIHDMVDGKSASGFGHPVCSDKSKEIAAGLSVSHKG